MKLLTLEAQKSLPPLYAQDGKGDEAIVHIKFFTPDGGWTWYVTEGCPIVTRDGQQMEVPYKDLEPEDKIDDWMFFGLVDGFEAEFGNFVLSELRAVRGKMGLPIERDMYYSNKTIADARNDISSAR